MDQGFFLAASESIHLPERKISDFYHALGSAQCEPSLATGITACGTQAAVDLLRLERVRGTTGFDGLERISTQTLMDVLQVPQRQRTAGNYRVLASRITLFQCHADERAWTSTRFRRRPGHRTRLSGLPRRWPPRGGLSRLRRATLMAFPPPLRCNCRRNTVAGNLND
jgi:hypothetical protein